MNQDAASHLQAAVLVSGAVRDLALAVEFLGAAVTNAGTALASLG